MSVTSDDIAGCLARNTFKNSLIVVDRCLHLTHECDLLVVPPCLRFVDVEVKISRADLKVDREKEKWWYTDWDARTYVRDPWGGNKPPRRPREWPKRVWKHYYAMPAPLWKDELFEHCGEISGVLLVHMKEDFAPRWWRVECIRRAKPNSQAETATPSDLRDLARLASLRMWDAYAAKASRKYVS